MLNQNYNEQTHIDVNCQINHKNQMIEAKILPHVNETIESIKKNNINFNLLPTYNIASINNCNSKTLKQFIQCDDSSKKINLPLVPMGYFGSAYSTLIRHYIDKSENPKIAIAIENKGSEIIKNVTPIIHIVNKHIKIFNDSATKYFNNYDIPFFFIIKIQDSLEFFINKLIKTNLGTFEDKIIWIQSFVNKLLSSLQKGLYWNEKFGEIFYDEILSLEKKINKKGLTVPIRNDLFSIDKFLSEKNGINVIKISNEKDLFNNLTNFDIHVLQCLQAFIYYSYDEKFEPQTSPFLKAPKLILNKGITIEALAITMGLGFNNISSYKTKKKLFKDIIKSLSSLSKSKTFYTYINKTKGKKVLTKKPLISIENKNFATDLEKDKKNIKNRIITIKEIYYPHGGFTLRSIDNSRKFLEIIFFDPLIKNNAREFIWSIIRIIESTIPSAITKSQTISKIFTKTINMPNKIIQSYLWKRNNKKLIEILNKVFYPINVKKKLGKLIISNER